MIKLHAKRGIKIQILTSIEIYMICPQLSSLFLGAANSYISFTANEILTIKRWRNMISSHLLHGYTIGLTSEMEI